jgi:hypothetical protein
VHVLLVEWRPLNIVRVLALRVITGVHQPNHAYNEHTGDETPAPGEFSDVMTMARFLRF